MSNEFYWADPHFGHEKTACVFTRPDGTPMRPFQNAQEQDETMVQRYLETVGPRDKCYFLGDIAMRKEFLPILHRLPGRKVLIGGNHDIFGARTYLEFFDEFHSIRVLRGREENIVLTHVPVHADSIERWGTNVHGHLHCNQVMVRSPLDGKTVVPDSRYLCVSVEHTDYRPLSYEEVVKRIQIRRDMFGRTPGVMSWAD